MTNQDELISLIQSLSPSEKRYFKVNASKGGDSKSNYMQLFEAVDGLEEYDEHELKRKHAKKPFVKYLSAEKKQLREQIMKQMRAFHSSRSVDNRIYELLQDEAIYQEKGLGELREKAILKAKELATEYERYHLLKQILKRQTGYVIEFEKQRLTEPVAQLINEQKLVAIQEETELELSTKKRELFSFLRSGSDLEDSVIRNRVEMLIAEVERFRPRLGDSFTLQANFERAYATYHHLHRNSKAAFEHAKNEYLLYQRFEHFKTEEAHNYKVCLANVMARSMSAKEKEWFLRAVDEMKSLPTSSFNEEGEVFQNVYFQEHLFYINNGEFDKAEALIPAIEAGLEKYASKVNKARLLAFQFNIMVMYFLMHRFKEALKWSEKLMDDKSEIKQHQKFVTVLLLPIIHFELGHTDLVDSLTRSAYRNLLKKKRLHEFERATVKYLKGMPLSPDRVEFREKLTHFDIELEKLMNHTSISSTLGMEEVSLWVKSHIIGQKMADILKDTTPSL
jgi:hypothetical protein